MFFEKGDIVEVDGIEYVVLEQYEHVPSYYVVFPANHASMLKSGAMKPHPDDVLYVYHEYMKSTGKTW